jgi:hypothetical protein
VGYFAQAEEDSLKLMLSNMAGFNVMPMSETDLHDSVFEAILAGPPSSSDQAELITGLGSANALSHLPLPRWHTNPRFSHLQRFEQSDTNADLKGVELRVPVKEQLSKASNSAEALRILTSRCAAEVKFIMQLSESELDLGLALTDLGVDSLIAVDIRSWFFRELGINIPVLGILNGSSINDVCKGALSQLDI